MAKGSLLMRAVLVGIEFCVEVVKAVCMTYQLVIILCQLLSALNTKFWTIRPEMFFILLQVASFQSQNILLGTKEK